MLPAEELSLGVFEDGFEDAREWLLQVVLEIVLAINGQVVLQSVDRILTLLPAFRALRSEGMT